MTIVDIYFLIGFLAGYLTKDAARGAANLLGPHLDRAGQALARKLFPKPVKVRKATRKPRRNKR